MSKFKEKIITIFKNDSRLWNAEKEELNRTLLKDLVDKFDEKVIESLLSDNEAKKQFFVKVRDVYVFKPNDFKFFLDENKIDNSYTQLANKIGLATEDGSDEKVVLNWPFKDCVLEGGMTKEDSMDVYYKYDKESGEWKEEKAKRKEIFFNEVLARDEIDRLEEPKAFYKWERFAAKGAEKIKEIKRDENGLIRENFVIKGNNLLALHSLKEEFEGKVKLIYIDPPYNTGGDAFAYNDNFNHSTWLTFMRNRLSVAQNLLKEDGSIFISLDDTESAYCKVLADDIFGRENYLATIAYQRSGAAGLGQGGKFVVNTAESILVYAKNKTKFVAYNLEGGVPLEIKHMKRYNGVLEDEGSKKVIKTFTSKSTGEDVKIYKHSNFKISTISLASFEKRKEEILKEYLSKFDKIFRLNIPQEENQFQHTLIAEMEDDDLYSVEYLVSRGKSKGNVVTNFYYKKQLLAWLASSAVKKDNSIIKTNKLTDFWAHGDIPKADLANEGGVRLLRGKKPEQLLKRILDLASEKDDLILDYHAGSGTTSAVAHKMGRQWIAIEQLDYSENNPEERMKGVVAGDRTGISKEVNWKGGGDFIYVQLAKWNEEAKENIAETKNYDELVKLFGTLYEKFFLNYNVRVKDFKEDIIKSKEFKELSLGEQKKIFVRMLDLNQMYINFSERNDKKYDLSKEDITLSEKFYNKK
jgi:adenine-specific DNA-methyltransferase